MEPRQSGARLGWTATLSPGPGCEEDSLSTFPHQYGNAYLPVCGFGRIILPLSGVEYTVGIKQLGCLCLQCVLQSHSEFCVKAYFKELMLFLEGTSLEAGGLCFTLHCGLMKNSKKRHSLKMLWSLGVSLCLLEFLAVEQERIAGSLELLPIT